MDTDLFLWPGYIFYYTLNVMFPEINKQCFGQTFCVTTGYKWGITVIKPGYNSSNHYP